VAIVIAPAGNRTRACTVAKNYPTTRPLVLQVEFYTNSFLTDKIFGSSSATALAEFSPGMLGRLMILSAIRTRFRRLLPIHSRVSLTLSGLCVLDCDARALVLSD
jgi:hypothetical protein